MVRCEWFEVGEQGLLATKTGPKHILVPSPEQEVYVIELRSEQSSREQRAKDSEPRKQEIFRIDSITFRPSGYSHR